MWWLVTLLFWASLIGMLWTGYQRHKMSLLLLAHNRELMKLLGTVTPLLPEDVQREVVSVVRRHTQEMNEWTRREVEATW